MPFINEKIPDSDKARIDWTRFRRDRWDTTGLQLQYLWTIDRDRDAFFVELDMGRSDWGTHPTYALYFRDTVIRIVTAASSVFSQKDRGIWEIEEIDLPPRPWSRKYRSTLPASRPERQ